MTAEQQAAPGQADLRQRLLDALDADTMRPRAERQGLVNVMLDVAEAELAARDAENTQLHAQLDDSRRAWRRVKSRLVASSDRLTPPFTNSPESPWTLLLPDVGRLDTALRDPTARPST